MHDGSLKITILHDVVFNFESSNTLTSLEVAGTNGRKMSFWGEIPPTLLLG